MKVSFTFNTFISMHPYCNQLTIPSIFDHTCREHKKTCLRRKLFSTKNNEIIIQYQENSKVLLQFYAQYRIYFWLEAVSSICIWSQILNQTLLQQLQLLLTQAKTNTILTFLNTSESDQKSCLNSSLLIVDIY